MDNNEHLNHIIVLIGELLSVDTSKDYDLRITLESILIDYGTEVSGQSVRIAINNFHKDISNGLETEQAYNKFKYGLPKIAHNLLTKNSYPLISYLKMIENWQNKEYNKEKALTMQKINELVNVLKDKYYSEDQIVKYLQIKTSNVFNQPNKWSIIGRRICMLIEQERDFE